MGFKVSATTAAGEKVPPTPPPLKMICFRNKQDVDRVVSGSLREHFGMENGEAFGIPQAPVGRGEASVHTHWPPFQCDVPCSHVTQAHTCPDSGVRGNWLPIQDLPLISCVTLDELPKFLLFLPV